MILGSRAELIWPKILLLMFVVGFPLRKLLVKLNASARTSIRLVSFNWKALERAASNCHVPGPTIVPAPKLPNVPAAGRANAAGLRYLPILLSPYRLGRTWLTRWLLIPLNATSELVMAVRN